MDLVTEGLKILRETRGSPLVMRGALGQGPQAFFGYRTPFGNKGGSARPRMDANSLLGQVIPKTPTGRIGRPEIKNPGSPFKYESGRIKTGQSNKGNTSKKNPDEDATMGAATDTFDIPTLDKPSHMYSKDFIERLNAGSPSAHHQVAPSVPAGDVAAAFQSDNAPNITRGFAPMPKKEKEIPIPQPRPTPPEDDKRRLLGNILDKVKTKVLRRK